MNEERTTAWQRLQRTIRAWMAAVGLQLAEVWWEIRHPSLLPRRLRPRAPTEPKLPEAPIVLAPGEQLRLEAVELPDELEALRGLLSERLGEHLDVVGAGEGFVVCLGKGPDLVVAIAPTLTEDRKQEALERALAAADDLQGRVELLRAGLARLHVGGANKGRASRLALVRADELEEHVSRIGRVNHAITVQPPFIGKGDPRPKPINREKRRSQGEQSANRPGFRPGYRP